MSIGDRLRGERERMGLSQPKFAELARTTKQTLFSWESGKTAPDGFQLAAFAAAGVDVLYVLTGERSNAFPASDAAEQVLLDSYRRCQPEARVNLIQTAVLLSAGLSPPSSPRAKSTGPASESVTVGNLTSSHEGSVQVGYARGKVTVKK